MTHSSLVSNEKANSKYLISYLSSPSCKRFTLLELVYTSEQVKGLGSLIDSLNQNLEQNVSDQNDHVLIGCFRASTNLGKSHTVSGGYRSFRQESVN